MVLVLLVLSIYWLFVFWLCTGWVNLSGNSNRASKEQELKLSGVNSTIGLGFISVVIAFRNESKHLLRILNAIDEQNFDKSKLEIIFVDDHSTDDSFKIIKEYSSKSFRPIILQANAQEQGKKASLKKAIEIAKGDIIVCTDADCCMGENWLKEMIGGFSSSKIKMVCGAVMFFERKGFWYQIMQLEFLSLIATGASSLQNGFPNMCNGANIAYRKSVFSEVYGFDGNEHIPSGDDEFLMHKIHDKYKGGVRFLKNNEAIVYTEPPQSISEFVNQRIRWGSKAGHYKRFKFKILPMFIFVLNLLLISTPVLGILGMHWTWIAILWIGKLGADLVFFALILPFFKQSKLLEIIIPAQLFHVVYISVIGVLSVFVSYKWKGRGTDGNEIPRASE